jgi:hypothetical protein
MVPYMADANYPSRRGSFSAPMTDLIPVKKSSLTPKQFDGLDDVPPERENAA